MTSADLRMMTFKGVVMALCQYEVVAILTGKTPTLTALSREHRWLPFVIVGGLAVHLWQARALPVSHVVP